MIRADGTSAICNLQFAFCILHFAFFLVFALPSQSRAEGQSPKIVGVRVGLADRYKAGLWTPVEVTLQGGAKDSSGEISLITADGDGVPAPNARTVCGPKDHAPSNTVSIYSASYPEDCDDNDPKSHVGEVLWRKTNSPNTRRQ